MPVSVNKVLLKLTDIHSFIHPFIHAPLSCDCFPTTAVPPSLRFRFCMVNLGLQVFNGNFQK